MNRNGSLSRLGATAWPAGAGAEPADATGRSIALLYLRELGQRAPGGEAQSYALIANGTSTLQSLTNDLIAYRTANPTADARRDNPALVTWATQQLAGGGGSGLPFGLTPLEALALGGLAYFALRPR